LRHHRRGPDRHTDERLHVALAAVLGLPVVVLIIGASLARRLGPSRPALLSIGLLAATLAVSAFSTPPIDARSSGEPPLIAADRESRATALLTPAIDTSQQVVPTTASSLGEHPTVTPTPEAPAVVRFRPRDGWAGVSRFAAVSVRFTRPMDRASTETAFRAIVGVRPVVGTYRWAEGDTVLVLTPASPLPYGARIALSVERGARTKDGATFTDVRSVTFTVLRRAAPIQRPPPHSGSARPSPGWRWPLIGQITQRFGDSLTQYGFHNGIDIDASTGDQVRAARRGRVVVAGSYDQCGGLEIHIDHGRGIASWYRHLSRIHVKEGTIVEAGTIIGRVGNTGCSLGSHLHFAIRKGATFVDPLLYLPAR
jgi:murein DD-endopeptidase MepM/ murein hydrolase activator NlpD